MGSIAKGFVQGNLTADPDQRTTAAGKTVCALRVAVNHNWTDEAGTKQEQVSFFAVAVFGKQGENCAKYLRKGDEVTVVGRLNQTRWDDEQGNHRERVEILADDVVFGRKRDGKTEPVAADEYQGVSDGPAGTVV